MGVCHNLTSQDITVLRTGNYYDLFNFPKFSDTLAIEVYFVALGLHRFSRSLERSFAGETMMTQPQLLYSSPVTNFSGCLPVKCW